MMPVEVFEAELQCHVQETSLWVFQYLEVAFKRWVHLDHKETGCQQQC